VSDDEIIVKVEQEATAPDTVVSTGTDVAAADDLKSQFEEIKKSADADKTAREAAERRAAEANRAADAARREAAVARTEASDHQFDTVTTGLQAAESEASSGEAEYAAAMEKGDFIGAAKAQRKIAASEAKILRFNEAKADLEARKTAPRTEAERPRDDAGRFVSQSDPVESYLRDRTEPTQRWLRAHTDWIVNPEKNRQLTRAHHAAVGAGHDPDTDGYFEHVETTIGLREKPAAATSATTQRRGAPPVAPVNGGGGGHSSGNGSSAKEVTLRAFEAKAANDGTHVWGQHDLKAGRIKDATLVGKPIGNQEFARRKLWAQQNNLYDKSFVES
jgi:hypothetical protein